MQVVVLGGLFVHWVVNQLVHKKHKYTDTVCKALASSAMLIRESGLSRDKDKQDINYDEVLKEIEEQLYLSNDYFETGKTTTEKKIDSFVENMATLVVGKVNSDYYILLQWLDLLKPILVELMWVGLLLLVVSCICLSDRHWAPENILSVFMCSCLCQNLCISKKPLFDMVVVACLYASLLLCCCRNTLFYVGAVTHIYPPFLCMFVRISVPECLFIILLFELSTTLHPSKVVVVLACSIYKWIQDKGDSVYLTAWPI